MTLPPACFPIGHPSTWNGQCLIDEFRILSRAMTPEEVKQDHAYLTAGNEFPYPASGRGEKVTFHPVPPKTVPAGLESQLEPVVFHACAAGKVNMTGRMSAPAWNRALPLPPMTRRDGKPGLPTLCKVIYTPDAFYVGCQMMEPDMKNLVAQFDQNDLAIYNDDCAEVIPETQGETVGLPLQHLHADAPGPGILPVLPLVRVPEKIGRRCLLDLPLLLRTRRLRFPGYKNRRRLLAG